MGNENNNTSGSKFTVFIVGLLIVFTLFTYGTRHRLGAKCRDGTSSYATGSGACSHHGGVKYWKYEYWWD